MIEGAPRHANGSVQRPAAPKPAAQKRPEPKRPYHVGVAIGLTTGVYAASLLVSARLQFAVDRAIIEDRTPAEAAISALGNHHDWMDDRLVEARTQYAEDALGFEALRSQLATVQSGLTDLDSIVRTVERMGAAVRTDLKLPPLPTRQSAQGNSGAQTGSSGGTIKPKAPAPRPAAPPPTSGSTGPSGG